MQASSARHRGSHGDSILPLEDHLLTESRNPHSESIDAMNPLEIVRLMNAEDAKVVEAVGAEADSIARRSSGPRTGFAGAAG